MTVCVVRNSSSCFRQLATISITVEYISEPTTPFYFSKITYMMDRGAHLRDIQRPVAALWAHISKVIKQKYAHFR